MLGADGIVIGPLTAAAEVDASQTRVLVDAAAGLPVTFHRAFDHTRDLGRSAEALMALGVTRVLTSGGAPSALQGVSEIASLVKRVGGALSVMAGGGVREEHVQELVHRSGVAEVHVRGTHAVSRGSSPAREGLKLRKALSADENAWDETDERRIKEFVRLANG